MDSTTSQNDQMSSNKKGIQEKKSLNSIRTKSNNLSKLSRPNNQKVLQPPPPQSSDAPVASPPAADDVTSSRETFPVENDESFFIVHKKRLSPPQSRKGAYSPPLPFQEFPLDSPKNEPSNPNIKTSSSNKPSTKPYLHSLKQPKNQYLSKNRQPKEKKSAFSAMRMTTVNVYDHLFDSSKPGINNGPITLNIDLGSGQQKREYNPRPAKSFKKQQLIMMKATAGGNVSNFSNYAANLTGGYNLNINNTAILNAGLSKAQQHPLITTITSSPSQTHNTFSILEATQEREDNFNKKFGKLNFKNLKQQQQQPLQQQKGKNFFLRKDEFGKQVVMEILQNAAQIDVNENNNNQQTQNPEDFSPIDPKVKQSIENIINYAKTKTKTKKKKKANPDASKHENQPNTDKFEEIDALEEEEEEEEEEDVEEREEHDGQLSPLKMESMMIRQGSFELKSPYVYDSPTNKSSKSTAQNANLVEDDGKFTPLQYDSNSSSSSPKMESKVKKQVFQGQRLQKTKSENNKLHRPMILSKPIIGAAGLKNLLKYPRIASGDPSLQFQPPAPLTDNPFMDSELFSISSPKSRKKELFMEKLYLDERLKSREKKLLDRHRTAEIYSKARNTKEIKEIKEDLWMKLSKLDTESVHKTSVINVSSNDNLNTSGNEYSDANDYLDDIQLPSKLRNLAHSEDYYQTDEKREYPTLSVMSANLSSNYYNMPSKHLGDSHNHGAKHKDFLYNDSYQTTAHTVEFGPLKKLFKNPSYTGPFENDLENFNFVNEKLIGNNCPPSPTATTATTNGGGAMSPSIYNLNPANTGNISPQNAASRSSKRNSNVSGNFSMVGFSGKKLRNFKNLYKNSNNFDKDLLLDPSLSKEERRTVILNLMKHDRKK